MRVAVDWDGTLVFEVWPGMGTWLPGGKEALREMVDAGVDVVIHSCRVAPRELDEVTPRDPMVEVDRIENFLASEGFDLRKIDIWTRPWKPRADYYIDDRGYRFTGNWREALEYIGVKGIRDFVAPGPVSEAVPHVVLEGQTETQVPYLDTSVLDEPALPRTLGDHDGMAPTAGERLYSGSEPTVTFESNKSERFQTLMQRWVDAGFITPATAEVTDQTPGAVRRFETGATRDTDEGKPDYEGFLSPLVVERFGEYMHKHRRQSDGTLRDSDNWQKGMPLDAYMKSGWRHFFDWWMEHRGHDSREGLEDALCALIFNAQGYLHEVLEAHREVKAA